MTGPGYVLLGDAACFVDPLFSTGVHLAISAAHIGAAYVVSALDDPNFAAEAADAFERLYRTQYEHFHELARLFYAGNRSVDSYFWETRRITGASAAPREAFVRAVSGQAAAGYERSVLSRGVLPSAFSDIAAAVKPIDVATDVANLTPALAPGLELVQTAVLGDGRFERGYAVRGERRVDLPVSPLVAQLGQPGGRQRRPVDRWPACRRHRPGARTAATRGYSGLAGGSPPPHPGSRFRPRC